MKCPTVSIAIFSAAVMLAVTTNALAQEAPAVSWLARQVLESLGRDATEFGGEAAVRQTVKRLLSEATAAEGAAGEKIAEKQIARIVANGNRVAITELKSASGKALPLLEHVADAELPAAVGTLGRAGVSDGILALSSKSLQEAALAGEMRLPGAGMKLVQHYGGEGAALAKSLSEDQANSVIAALRPNAVNAMEAGERGRFFNALTSRPDARVFNLSDVGALAESATKPLLIVASGIVIWHGTDVVLGPDERVTEQSDGTVIRERTTVGSKAAAAIPAVAVAASHLTLWIGLAAITGVTLVVGLISWLKYGRRPLR